MKEPQKLYNISSQWESVIYSTRQNGWERLIILIYSASGPSVLCCSFSKTQFTSGSSFFSGLCPESANVNIINSLLTYTGFFHFWNFSSPASLFLHPSNIFYNMVFKVHPVFFLLVVPSRTILWPTKHHPCMEVSPHIIQQGFINPALTPKWRSF